MENVESGVELYHEVQEARLCAVHCLNAVLQGPYFTEVELAAIAKELDDREREVMHATGEQTVDYLREGTSNVSLDGDFSIQVLEKALDALDLRCVPLDAPDAEEARSAPHEQNAFICNLQEHWFAIRKVGNEWYNFNSLYPAPEHLSDFYLSAYIDSLKESGWSIFVVLGELPPNTSPLRSFGSRFGRWLTPHQASALLKSPKEAEQNTDPLLEAAIAASLAEYSSFPKNPIFVDEDTSELAASIVAGLANVRPP